MTVEILNNIPVNAPGDNALLEMFAAKAALDTKKDVKPTGKLRFITLDRTVVITRTAAVASPTVTLTGPVTYISVPIPPGYEEGSFMILSKDDLSIHGSFPGGKAALAMADAIEKKLIKTVRAAFPNEEITLHSNSVSLLRKKIPLINKIAGFSSGLTAQGAEFFGSVWFNFDSVTYASQVAKGHVWNPELATTSFATEGNKLVTKVQLIQDIIASLVEQFPAETFNTGGTTP